MATVQAQGNSFFTPTQISGCQLWLDASDVNGNGSSVANGASVSTWRDKSGNGNTATATVAPTYDATSKYVLFNGTNQFFNLPNGTYPFGNTPYSIFIVAYTRNAANPQWVLAGGTNVTNQGIGLLFYTTNAVWHSWWVNEYRQDNAITNNIPSIINISYSSVRSIVVNGGTPSINNPGTVRSSPNTSNYIGCIIGATNVQNFNGGMAECIVFNSEIPTSQRQQVEGYLAWKWGLQSSLPATHPYKNSPIPPLLNPPTSLPISIQNSFFLPTQISGCVTWLDAADTSTITVSGSSVTQWADKGSRRYVFTQSNTSLSPKSGLNRLNGLNMITTQGSQYLQITNYRQDFTTCSFFCVVTATNTFSNWDFLGIFMVPQVNGGPYFYTELVGIAPNTYGFTVSSFNFGSMSANQGTTPPIGTPFVYSGFLTGNSSTNFINVNGSQSALTFNGANGGLSASLSNTTVYTAGYPGNAKSGLYGDIIMFNRILSQSEYQRIEGYLAWKWGLQSSLPAAHPYKVSLFPPLLNPPISLPVATSGSWNPIRYSGCTLWLDGADPNANGILPSNGANISTWVDKSGNGKNATTSTNYPIFSSKSLNGLGTIRFNGASGTVNYLDIPSFDFGTSQRSAFFVIQNTGPTSGAASAPHWFWPNTGNGTNSLSMVIWMETRIQGTTQNIIVNLNRNQYYLISYVFGSSSGLEQLYLSSSLAGTYIKSNGGTSYANATSGYRLGWLNNNDPPTNYYYDGNMGEIIIFNRALTTSQQQQVEGYLAWKWGLVSSLPANHPWKNWPPPP